MQADRMHATLDEEQLRKALDVVERLRDHFHEWVQDDLEAAAQAIVDARAAAPDDLGPYRVLRQSAHNFQGLGGSFGYDLVTEIGRSLGGMLRRADAVRDDVTEAAAAHVEALAAVVRNRVTGEGGPEERRLVARLAARARAVAPPSDDA